MKKVAVTLHVKQKFTHIRKSAVLVSCDGPELMTIETHCIAVERQCCFTTGDVMYFLRKAALNLLSKSGG